MWLDNASEIDILFYQPYAQFVADTICERDNTPLTVGLFGNWGAGKSTLVNLVRTELDKKDKAIIIDTNAWLYEGYTDAKTSLMETITTELSVHQKASQTVKNKCISLLSRINKLKMAKSIMTFGASALSLFTTGNPLTLSGVVDGAKGMVDAFNGDEIKETCASDIAEFRKEFSELIDSFEAKTAIFVIDDLDRCSPERIIDTLEAIKLFLSVKGTVFLIAADEDIIKYSIDSKYPGLSKQENRYSTEYIEKIIQLPIKIPSLSTKDVENYLMLLVAQKYLKPEELIKLLAIVQEKKWHIRDSSISYSELLSLVGELSGQPLKTLVNGKESFERDIQIIDGIRETVARVLKGNPRQTKRFLNTFIIKKSLAELYYPGEINDAVLAKLLALHQVSPDLFRQLYEWNNQFDGQIPHLRDALDGQEDKYKEWQTIDIQKWKLCPPVEIDEIPLDRYFYLTRENLAIQSKDPTLTIEGKMMLTRLSKATGGTLDRIFVDLKLLSQQEQNTVIDIFVSKMTGKANDWNTAQLILTHYPSKKTIVLQKIQTMNISMAALPFLQAIYVSDRAAHVELESRITDSTAKRVLERSKEQGR